MRFGKPEKGRSLFQNQAGMCWMQGIANRTL